MAHNVNGKQQTHYWYFIHVKNLLNYLLLHAVLNVIQGPACLTILAVSLITMVVVITI